MPEWHVHRHRQSAAADLNGELTDLLDQEHALRLELGLPVTDPVPPRYREQAAAPVRNGSREPGRRSTTLALIWVCGLLLIAAIVFRSEIIMPAEADPPPCWSGRSGPGAG